MGKPIYQQICDNITEGVLDLGFSLHEEEPDDSQIKWAPGAMDGICLYHMGHEGLDATQAKGMARALKCAASGNDAKTDELFFEWTKDVRAVSCVDQLQKYVIDHARTLDAGEIFNTALPQLFLSDG